MKRNRNEFKRLAKGSCWLPHFILFAKSTEKSLNCLSTWNFLRANIEEKKKWRRRQKYEKLRHSYRAITPTSRQKYTATSKKCPPVHRCRRRLFFRAVTFSATAFNSSNALFLPWCEFRVACEFNIYFKFQFAHFALWLAAETTDETETKITQTKVCVREKWRIWVKKSTRLECEMRIIDEDKQKHKKVEILSLWKRSIPFVLCCCYCWCQVKTSQRSPFSQANMKNIPNLEIHRKWFSSSLIDTSCIHKHFNWSS